MQNCAQAEPEKRQSMLVLCMCLCNLHPRWAKSNGGWLLLEQNWVGFNPILCRNDGCSVPRLVLLPQCSRAARGPRKNSSDQLPTK